MATRNGARIRNGSLRGAPVVLLSLLAQGVFSPVVSAGSPEAQRSSHEPSRRSMLGACFEHPGKIYKLDSSLQGNSFFDGFDFAAGVGPTHGSEQYLSREDASSEALTEVSENHAIVRVGGKGWLYKRKSVRLETKKSWKYFLAAMRFSHSPYGCSMWPGFWMVSVAPNVSWPNGGELDILEYANDVAGGPSLHVGDKDRCKIDATLVNKQGCTAFPDRNGMNYDCVTNYDLHKLGCAPSSTRMPGVAWSQPGALAVEWTDSYIKVFYFKDAEIPQDLLDDNPTPDSWDKWVISYYPFAASEKAVPGSCPSPENVLLEQRLVLQTALCGDWAGGVWTPNCAGKTANCSVNIWDPAHDCCTQFIWDSDNDKYFEETGYFNISWLKVYQDRDRRGKGSLPEQAATVTI